jgi:hypothetical protein
MKINILQVISKYQNTRPDPEIFCSEPLAFEAREGSVIRYLLPYQIRILIYQSYLFEC